MKNIGFIGLGNMGISMSENLVKNGFNLTGFDLSQTQLDALRELGGTPATTCKEVGEKYAEGQERYTFDAAGYSFHVILDDESKGIRQVSIGRGGGKMMIITIGNYGSGLVEITLGKRVVGKVECQKPNVGDVKTMEKITEKFYLIIGRKIDGRETDEAGEY